jgi:hypothetical protein
MSHQFHCPRCWTPVRKDVRLYLNTLAECDTQFCDPRRVAMTEGEK